MDFARCGLFDIVSAHSKRYDVFRKSGYRWRHFFTAKKNSGKVLNDLKFVVLRENLPQIIIIIPKLD